jgi:hypothetical protein
VGGVALLALFLDKSTERVCLGSLGKCVRLWPEQSTRTEYTRSDEVTRRVCIDVSRHVQLSLLGHVGVTCFA